MNIIICGAGKVGFSISKQLSAQGHSITVIDQSSELIQKINEAQDVKGIVGTATFPSVLEKAGAEDADMIIAVTKSDETNMVICQVAYSIFKVAKKIARIRTQEFLNAKFNKLFGEANLPIDVIISPEMEVARSLQRRLEAPGALDNVPFANNKITVLEINVDKSCPLVNTELTELTKKFPNLNANILGVIREGKFVILKKKDKLKVDDKAFVVISASQIDLTLSAFGHEEKMSKKILIIGGGNIGYNLAKNLENDYEGIRVKIIEKNKERAEFIANELNNTIVINGDGLEEDVLKEANIQEVETILSLTNDDEVNIMSSLLAKRLGARKVITLINKAAYVDLVQGGMVDVALSPQQATIGSLLTHVRRGDVVNVHSLRRGAAEAIEAIAHGDSRSSKVVGRKIREIKLPPGTTIGAIVRGEEVIMASSDVLVESDDHVILFVMNKKHIADVERLFQVGLGFF